MPPYLELDVFTLQRLIVPVHNINRQHWGLIDVDFQNETISYYDSSYTLGEGAQQCEVRELYPWP